ncbi:MAG: class I SAM-dependent methyltransferase, partial [Nitrososphaerales archaeon]
HEWAAHLQTEVLPRLLEGVGLGKAMLEMGPGAGAATEWLRHRVDQLTLVEIDAAAARALANRYAGSNVTVMTGDCSYTGLPDQAFDSVGTFTMLHHVPTPALQHAVLAEARRLLRPGGLLVGSDSVASTKLRAFHVDDNYNPIKPERLLFELRALGFRPIWIDLDGLLTFRARAGGFEDMGVDNHPIGATNPGPQPASRNDSPRTIGTKPSPASSGALH